MKYSINELLSKYQIIIPQLQRDYAQGRDSEAELRIDFIRKINQALQNDSESLNLDFIYGYTKEIGNAKYAFIPLDGQQRLTTLWLILWYLSPREDDLIPEENQLFLSNFTYETRLSSKRFCLSLVNKSLNYSLNKPILNQIIDAPWFISSWLNDPTILSMLNMLNTIQQEILDKETAWNNLVNNYKITFDYIDIKSDEFKLTDELYIKMNSRGKPLTSFENFKAQFSSLLASKETDYADLKLTFNNTLVSYQQYFAFNIDCKWMDLFWSYRTKVIEYNKSKNKNEHISIDSCIYNFVFGLAELLYYKDQNNTNAFKRDIEHINLVFKDRLNLLFLFDALDFLSNLDNVEAYFELIFSNNEFIEGKVKLFDDRTTDLFFRAITITNFDVRHNILLYSILSFSIKKNLSEPDNSLKDIVRVIRNLLLRVRQPNASIKVEYMSNLRVNSFVEYSEFIDKFINDITIQDNLSVYYVFGNEKYKGFGQESIKAEQYKAICIVENEILRNTIHKLEDHNYLQGVTDNFNLKTENFAIKAEAFRKVWSPTTDTSLLIRSLLVFGDYSVCTHGYTSLGKAMYFGTNGSWNRILTTSYVADQDKIKPILDNFLEAYLNTKSTKVEGKLNEIIKKYIPSDFKDWIYYFIKYPEMTSMDRLNLFSWEDEGFKIYSLGNSGKQPLSSYHYSPYICTLMFVLNDEKNSNWYWARHSDSFSYIILCNRFKVYCITEGWLIITEKRKPLSDSLIEKHKITVNEDGNWELICKKNKDKIKLAKALCEDIILEFK